MIRKPRVFSLGHSDRSLDSFIRLLEKSSILLVADVRSNPASSRFPHFERNALSASLEDHGISYRWFRGLGGRAPSSPSEMVHTSLATSDFKRYAAKMNTPAFTAEVRDLVGLISSTVAVILCAERDFHQCHRRFLSDKLHTMGVRVVHIQDEVTAIDHTLHPDLMLQGDDLIYRSRQLDLLK